MWKQPEGRSAHADGCFLRARDGPGQKSEMIRSFTDTTSGLAGIRRSAFVLISDPAMVRTWVWGTGSDPWCHPPEQRTKRFRGDG